jgi:hypothetical protein
MFLGGGRAREEQTRPPAGKECWCYLVLGGSFFTDRAQGVLVAGQGPKHGSFCDLEGFSRRPDRSRRSQMLMLSKDCQHSAVLEPELDGSGCLVRALRQRATEAAYGHQTTVAIRLREILVMITYFWEWLPRCQVSVPSTVATTDKSAVFIPI